MPSKHRSCCAGYAYHVLNRRAGRAKLFNSEGDYLAFLRVVAEAQAELACRLLAFCLMPTHWHFLFWPQADNEISRFLHRISLTHAKRKHAFQQTAGTGPIYQCRFKSFPIQQDHHFLVVARYVERNALTANLVTLAEAWPWSSLAVRNGVLQEPKIRLDDWPVRRPDNWQAIVNTPQTERELNAIRQSLSRGCPFGEEQWIKDTARTLRIESTLRMRGRPRKEK